MPSTLFLGEEEIVLEYFDLYNLDRFEKDTFAFPHV